VTLTRPRKARLLEGAGLRYVGAWLPQKVAADLAPAIAEGDAMVAEVLAKVGGKRRNDMTPDPEPSGSTRTNGGV